MYNSTRRTGLQSYGLVKFGRMLKDYASAVPTNTVPFKHEVKMLCKDTTTAKQMRFQKPRLFVRAPGEDHLQHPPSSDIENAYLRRMERSCRNPGE